MNNSVVLVVEKPFAQITRKYLEEHKIWDASRKLVKINSDQVAIPVLCVPSKKLEIPSLPEYTIQKFKCPLSKKASRISPYQSMVKNIEGLIADSAIFSLISHEIPQFWEFHGDLLLLPQHSFVSETWSHFGDALWECVCSSLKCARVARKATISNNDFRSPQVELLFGNDSWVEHIDNAIKYGYDIKHSMFSAGNITEKLRVAAMNCQGETVVDLYAGIGYFTLPYLVHARASHVHACEWNPEAVKALRWNLSANGVSDRCTIHCGDNKQVCPSFVADRVNLGLIPSSEDGWPVACRALKPTGGSLHIHQNVSTKEQLTDMDSECNHKRADKGVVCAHREPESSCCEVVAKCSECGKMNANEVNSEQKCKEIFCGKTEDCASSRRVRTLWCNWADQVKLKIRKLLSDIHETEWTVNVVHIEHVKSYAPHVDHVVLDLNCQPLCIEVI